MKEEAADKFFSINLARTLMRIIGFWTAETKAERRSLNVRFGYTIFAIFVALWVVSCDFYFSMGNFYDITYTACSAMPVFIILCKVGIFLYHRKEIMKLIRYTQNNFWYVEHDAYGEEVMKEANRTGVILIKNIGKNASDRILPFNLWLGVPLTVSPYFELGFLMQIVALVQSGLLFCCFDNFLGLLNIHVAAQFKILNHRFREIFSREYKPLNKDNWQQIHGEFKQCVLQHRALISYMEKMEFVFAHATLCQLLISSIMLCVAGFQVFLGQGSLVGRLIFIAHTNGCFFQLFVITLTANEVTVQSMAVADATYGMDWESSIYEENKVLSSSMIIIMLRARKPCCITAGGFFPVTLETFMSVLSTAGSYFALLRKFDGDQGQQSVKEV
ncbi:hypothetical protein KM043_006964 [Ampulex compressa]|nr:hypothetical protein KM043_006964 [Ampulex compressa]